MAVIVETGVVTKKFNSTLHAFDNYKRASNTVRLKEPCSVQSPSITIYHSDLYPDANYMSILYESDNRKYYYWIDDIIYENAELVTINGSLDALGTYAVEIGNASGICNYGRKSKSDIYLPDPRFSPEVCWDQQDHSYRYGEGIFDFSYGCVIMTVLSSGDTLSGANAGVKTLVGSLMDFLVFTTVYCTGIISLSNSFSSAMDKLAGKVLGLGSIQNYIKSAIWVPFSKDYIVSLLGPNPQPFESYIGGYRIYHDPSSGQTNPGWYKFPEVYIGQPTRLKLYGSTPIEIQWPAICHAYPWLMDPQYTQVLISTPGGQQDISSELYKDFLKNNRTPGTPSRPFIYGELFADFYNGDFLYTVHNQQHELVASFNWQTKIDLLHLADKAPAVLDQFAKTIGNAGKELIAMGAEFTKSYHAAVSSNESSTSGTFNKRPFAGNTKTGTTSMETSVSFNPTKTISSGIFGMCKAPSVNPVVHSMSLAPNNLANWRIGNAYHSDGTPAVDEKDFIHIYTKTFIPALMRDYDITTQESAQYEDFCTEYGYPVFQYGKVMDFAGLPNPEQHSGPYVEMAGCSFKGVPFQSAISEINTSLNTGLEWLPRDAY